MHEIYDESRPIYLETDVSNVSLQATLLQVRHSMNCGHYEVPDSATLHPNAFTSKHLLATEQHSSNIQGEVLGILHGL